MKTGLIVLIFVLAFLCFLTRARTANVLIIGEAILLILATVVYRNYIFKRVVILIMCLLCAFGGAIMAGGILQGRSIEGPKIEGPKLAENYIKDNITSVAGDDKRSNGARYGVLEAYIKMGLDYPVLGVGDTLRSAYVAAYLPPKAFSNSEIKMWLRDQKEKGILKSGIPPLGEYSTRFAETGLVGLGIFMVPPVFLVLKLLKRIKSGTTAFEEKLGYIFFVISFCGILASGMGDSLNITCCYWLLLGLGYASIFAETEKKKL